MAIQVQRDLHRCVPKPLLHDLRRYTGGEAERGMRVSEVVEADRRDAGDLDEPTEVPPNRGRVKSGAVLAGEDMSAVSPRLTPGEPLLELPAPPRAQHRHGRRIEVDGAGLRRLGRTRVHRMVDRHTVLADH